MEARERPLWLQWKFLASEYTNLQNARLEWEKGISNKVWQKGKKLLNDALMDLRETFLGQSTRTQLFIVLAVIFGLGLASLMTILHPIWLIFYLLLICAIGIPVITAMNRVMNYFNQIAETTKELAAGKMGDDLQIQGSSLLAELAGNINNLCFDCTRIQITFPQ
jgi:hypothetical protein